MKSGRGHPKPDNIPRRGYGVWVVLLQARTKTTNTPKNHKIVTFFKQPINRAFFKVQTPYPIRQNRPKARYAGLLRAFKRQIRENPYNPSSFLMLLTVCFPEPTAFAIASKDIVFLPSALSFNSLIISALFSGVSLD